MLLASSRTSCNMISYFIILALLDLRLVNYFVFLIVKPWPTFNYCDRVVPFRTGMHHWSFSFNYILF